MKLALAVTTVTLAAAVTYIVAFPNTPDAPAAPAGRGADAGPPSDTSTYNCAAPKPPLLIVAVGGAGTDLLKAPEGESLGLLDIVNELQTRATVAGLSTLPILTSSAITGANPGQTSMEHWL